MPNRTLTMKCRIIFEQKSILLLKVNFSLYFLCPILMLSVSDYLNIKKFKTMQENIHECKCDLFSKSIFLYCKCAICNGVLESASNAYI